MLTSSRLVSALLVSRKKKQREGRVGLPPPGTSITCINYIEVFSISNKIAIPVLSGNKIHGDLSSIPLSFQTKHVCDGYEGAP